MKPSKLPMILRGGALIALLAAAACGDSAQERAFAQAVQLEQQTRENPKTVIAEYRQVIRMSPDSACARKAQARIDAIDAKLKADELHRSVFQEHGVD